MSNSVNTVGKAALFATAAIVCGNTAIDSLRRVVTGQDNSGLQKAVFVMSVLAASLSADALFRTGR